MGGGGGGKYKEGLYCQCEFRTVASSLPLKTRDQRHSVRFPKHGSDQNGQIKVLSNRPVREGKGLYYPRGKRFDWVWLNLTFKTIRFKYLTI